MAWNWAQKAYETMKRWVPDRHSLLLLGALGIGGEGCTLMTETEGWPEDKPPVTGQASPDEDYKVPSTTKVLDEEWIAQLKTITDDGTLVFPKNSAYGQSLEKGDIVIAGVSDKTPYGLLRRVGEIARREDIRVQTRSASLEEAVEEGSLRTHIDFSQAYLDQTQINANTETRRDALRGELHEEGTMKIDFGSTELTPGIEINGYAQLTVGMDLEIEIKRFTLEHFKLGVTGNEKLVLEFIAEYERAYEKELPPIEPIPLKPFTIWAWGIPIVIFPHYSITLGFEAGARIDISAAIEQEARAEIALVYKKETGFVPVSDFQNTYGLRYDPDFVGITGKGELYAKHKLLFAPYNIGGAFVSFRGGVGAEVTLEELIVYANLGVAAGAELRALKREDGEEGAEGEGEGEGERWEEIEYPPMSIEIPLYSHREDLLRKRLGGGEPSEGEGEPSEGEGDLLPEPTIENICGDYSLSGRPETTRGCEVLHYGLGIHQNYWQRRFQLSVNNGVLTGQQWNVFDHNYERLTGTRDMEGNTSFTSEPKEVTLVSIGQRIDIEPCRGTINSQFSGNLDSSTVSGTYTLTLSETHGSDCDTWEIPAYCQFVLRGDGEGPFGVGECDHDNYNCIFGPETKQCLDEEALVRNGCGDLIERISCRNSCIDGECVGGEEPPRDCDAREHSTCRDERTLRRTDDCGNILSILDCERSFGEGYRCVQGECVPPQQQPPAEGEGEPAEGEGQEGGNSQCGFTYGHGAMDGIPEFGYIGSMIPVFSYITGPGFNVELNIQGQNVTATFRRRPTEEGDDPVPYTYHGTLDGRILQMTSPPTVLRPRGVDCILTHESAWTGTFTQNRNGAVFSGREVAQWYNNRGSYCPDDPAIQEHMETAFENDVMDDAIDRCE